MSFEKPGFPTMEKKPETKEAKTEKINWENFEEIDAIEAPVDSMGAAAFSPDGKFIIGNEGRKIRVLNSATGSELAKFESGTEISSLALRRDGTLFVGDGEGDLRFFDIKQSKEFRNKFNPLSSITAMTMFGDRVVYAGKDQGIKEFDLIAKEPHLLMSAREQVSAIAVSPDLRIAYGSKKGILDIGDPATKRYEVSVDLKENITTLAFAPDGKLLVGLEGGTIKVLDSKTGQELKTLQGHSADVMSLSWTADKRVKSASKDGTIRTWGTK